MRLGQPNRSSRARQNFAAGHAHLALLLWVEVRDAQPAQQKLLLARARSEAERAIQIDPAQSAEAYGTLLYIQAYADETDYVGQEVRLDAAMRAAPDFAGLASHKCMLLFDVGRAKESLYYCRRALARRPLAGWRLYRYAIATAAAGDPQFAIRIADRAARFNPEHDMLRHTRFDLEAWGGSPDKALALLHDPATTPPFAADAVAALTLVMEARKSGASQDADRALAAMRRAFDRPEIMWKREYLVASAMELGRMDEAFGYLDSSRFPMGGAVILMGTYAGPLQRDPRFWPLAAKTGLVRYWTTTNKWPDFCRDPSYPLDCRAEAERVKDVPLATRAG